MKLLTSDFYQLFIRKHSGNSVSELRLMRYIYLTRIAISASFFLIKEVNLVTIALLSLPSAIITIGIKSSLKGIDFLKILILKKQEKYVFLTGAFFLTSYFILECYRYFTLEVNNQLYVQIGFVEYCIKNSHLESWTNLFYNSELKNLY